MNFISLPFKNIFPRDVDEHKTFLIFLSLYIYIHIYTTLYTKKRNKKNKIVRGNVQMIHHRGWEYINLH